jgi:hypothetical protein
MTSRPARRKKLLAALTITVALGACAKDSPTSPPTSLAFGEWGAVNAQVVATDSVTRVVYECTFGEFAGNITLTTDGRFSANGTYVPYFLSSALMPAQLSGQVVGNTLTFAIAVSDTIQKRVFSLGPQTVELGQHASLVVCPG